MRPLILASRSPRRRTILRLAGIPFRVIAPSGVDESPRPGEAPRVLAKRLALEKALEVSRREPGSWVLGADTVVALGNLALGKPRNKAEARKMVSCLQGRSHWVYTGVALVRQGGRRKKVRVERAKVRFRSVSRKEWVPYIQSREPYDKAGGYGIQGTAKSWLKGYEGEYFTILGLPLRWLLAQLADLKRSGRS